MDPFMMCWVFLIGIIIGIIIATILIQHTAVIPLHRQIDTLSKKTSFTPPPPYSPENFHYLGTPIDGIQFEKNIIIFIQSRSPKSKLTPLQNQIKQLVIDKKVQWHEFNK